MYARARRSSGVLGVATLRSLRAWAKERQSPLITWGQTDTQHTNSVQRHLTYRKIILVARSLMLVRSSRSLVSWSGEAPSSRSVLKNVGIQGSTPSNRILTYLHDKGCDILVEYPRIRVRLSGS